MSGYHMVERFTSDDTSIMIPLWLTYINGEYWHYQTVKGKWDKITSNHYPI